MPMGLFALMALGGGNFGGLIKKVLFYSMFGMVGLLIGGGFNIKDFLLVPMLAPMFGSALGMTGSEVL